MAQTQVGIKLTLDGAQQVEQGVRRVISSVDSLGTQFTRLGQLAAGAFSVRELVTAADAYATLTGRIKLASEGLGDAAQAQKQLFDIANTARTSVEGLSNTYASLARAAGESGRSQAELLRTTDTLAKAMTIGGGAVESQKAALMQFAQGLSAGTLRGEELNSVMEQAPRLAKALADGLGVPTGALKTLAEEGRITADAIFEALERSRAKIEQEFTQLPTTIGQALTVLNNSFMQTIGVFDETNKISSGFADAILGIGKNMDVVVPTVGAMAAGLVVLRTSATAAAVATGALGTAVGVLGGPIGLIATALGIGATAWMAWKGAATDSEKAVETQVVNSDAEIQSRIDAQIGKLRERNRLATEGMPEARTGVERAAADAASLYSGQLSRYQKIQSGAGEFAGLTDATRAALLQASAKSMAKAYSQYTELTAETAKQAEAKNRETFEKFTKGYKSAQEKAKEELAKYEKEFKPKIGIGISQAEYDAGYKAIEERTKKTESATKATKELRDAEKQALAGLELYSNLIAETAGFQGDYAEKASQLAEAYAANKISLEGFTFAHEKLLAKQPAAVEATKMEAEARKVLADAVTASARAYEEAQQAMESQVQSLWQSMNAATQAGKDEAEALQFELSLMGKSADARVLEIEQNKIRIKLKRELAAIDATPFEDESQRLAARVQAEENAAREMANAGLKAQLESQKTIESEWKKTTEQINQSLTDALMRGFESGKGFLENLRDTAVNLFKTLVLRPVISAVMSPITAGLSGALGLAGAAQAGQAAAGGGAASTALSGLGLATSAFGQSLWAGMSTTFASGFSTLGLAIEGGLASIATGTASGIAAGLGQALGAVSAVALPAAVVANALGLFRKTTQVDNGIKGSLGYDSDLTLFDRMRKSGTLFSGPDYWDREKEMDPKLAQALDTQVRAIYTAGEQYAAALGLTADGVRDITREIRISTEGLTDAQVQEKLYAEFAALGETIAQSLLGTTETITETVKEMQLVPADDDMGMVYQEVEKTITRVVAVQSEYARTGETSAQTLTRLASSLTTVNAAFDMLGMTLLSASLASGDYASQLIDAVGGGAAFAQAAGSFFENYYSEAEKVAYATELVTKELATAGLTMPKTRAEFKAMVEAQRALGPAGKDGLAALLRVNGAFAQLVPAADEAAGAVTSFFDSLAEGVSGQIEDVLTNVLLGKADGATAGAELAAAVVGGVQQAIISGTTSVIAETFTASIIAPIIANVTAGRAAMEGVDLDAAIASATAQMQALQAVLTSPEVTSGFASITGALNNLVGAAQSAAGGINAAAGSAPSGGSYTPGLFAIGGSAPGPYVPPTVTRLLGSLEDVGKDIQAAVDRTTELLDGVGVKKVEGLEQLQKTATELFETLGGPKLEIAAAAVASRTETLAALMPAANQLVGHLSSIQAPPLGFTPDAAKTMADQIRGMIEQLPGVGTMVKEWLQSSGDNISSTWDGIERYLEDPASNQYLGTRILTAVQSFAETTANIGPAQQELDRLNAAMRDWMKAQTRLMATEDLAKLSDDTFAAKDRIEELKRTGGLEDPITKLKEAFAQKIKTIDDGIGKILTEEINALLGTKADTSALDQKLAGLKGQRDKISADGYVEATIQELTTEAAKYLTGYEDANRAVQNQIQVWAASIGTDMEAYNLALLSNMSDTGWMLGRHFSALDEIARLKAGGNVQDIAALDKAIADTEEEIRKAVLAATDPAKRAALQAEIDTYKGGITEWYKAQQELLSTEMLVDINAQIRELEKADQGPLTAIKAGIQKYIDDLKALDQLTPEAQAQIDKLSNLQLTQTRGDLEAQLLSKPELEARDLSALTANFAALGQQLPATAADFKALLATITDPTQRDALLELVPAFVALRPPLDGATDAATEAAETIQQAYDRLRTVNRTNEDIARERIDLEERLFQATASQAEIANLARLRIDEYNRSLYDQVIAAEAAQQAVQDTRTATDQALSEVRRLIGAEISSLQKTFSATDKAMQAVDRAAAAQRTVLQKQITDAKATEASVKGIFDALRSGARELRGEVDSTAALQAQQARELIRNAIATGALPTQDALDEAISTSRAGLEAQVYASEQDAEFAKLVLAGELEKLQDIAQPQLSAAEQAVILAEEQLAALEDQVKQAKAMVDGIRGVDGRVLTVGEAVAELQTAAAAETLARGQIDKLQLQLSEAEKSYNELRGIKTGVDAIAPALQALADAIAGEQSAAAKAAALAAAAAAQRQAIANAASGQYGASVEYVRDFGAGSAMADTSYANQREADIASLYQNVLGRTADSGGLAYYAGTAMSIAEIAASLEASREDDIRDAYGGAAQQAFNDQVNAALGLASDIRIPGFATGGRYPGGLALVGEEDPELINFAQPGQVYTAPQTRALLGGMGGSERMASLMGEMAQEIRSLRAEVVQLRRSADKGNEHTAVIAQAHEGRGQAPLLVEIAQ